MTPNHMLDAREVGRFVSGLFADDLHAKRVSSLADATLGALRGASLAVSVIGAGLAAAKGLDVRHATKQVDRLLSNPGIDLDRLLPLWVPYVAADRTSIMVAMDWTDFDADHQSTIMLSLFTDHGRATPLVWLTVDKRTLKDQRNQHEYRALIRLAEILPPDVRVCIVADRGFGDRKLYRLLTEELNFDYIIRFRGNIAVTTADGETRTAVSWVGPSGRATMLRGASVTAERYTVGTVVCLRDKGMKQAWCLATSYRDRTPGELAGHYGKRWGSRRGCATPRTSASAWAWPPSMSAHPNGGTGFG
jgi:Transposase DDE domain